MRKLRITALSALLLMAGLAAQAQNVSSPVSSIAAQDENVNVSYTIDQKGPTQTATFTLVNKGDIPFKPYGNIAIELPPVSGYTYDLTTLTWGSNCTPNKPTAAELRPSANIINFPAGSKLTFTCQLSPSENPTKQEVVIFKL